MKKSARAAFVLLVCLLVSACQQKHPDSSTTVVVTAVDFSGSPVRLPAADAPVTVLNLWATWCVPCKAEIKNLIALHDEFRGRGCRIVGIALDSIQPANLGPAVAALSIPYPVYAGNADEILRSTGVSAIPATVFIRQSGAIVKRLVGYHSMKELRTAFEEVLADAQRP